MCAVTDMKPCPFCGGTKLDLSVKTRGDYYHCVVYCKTCRAYGPRTILKLDEGEYMYKHTSYNESVLSNHSVREKAADIWNKRS